MAKPPDKIVQRTKKVDKQFFKLSPEEQYKRVANMLKDLSPNETVRNREQ
jgi:hypothetical protein